VAYVIEGILFGLMLAIMLGPIFIALTQTSLEKGARAGMLVALGVWISDLIIVFLAYTFINSISDTIESDDFKFYLGLSGGIVLFFFGFIAFFKSVDLDVQQKKHSYKNLFGYWLKGFLVNTINPFTFIFWLGVISTYVIGRNISVTNTWIFLSTIIITIVITDALKVIGAKALRNVLSKNHIRLFSKISGVGLMIFGVFLIIRCL